LTPTLINSWVGIVRPRIDEVAPYLALVFVGYGSEREVECLGEMGGVEEDCGFGGPVLILISG